MGRHGGWPQAHDRRAAGRPPDGCGGTGGRTADHPVRRVTHLKILKDAGLVSERAAGTRRIYRLNPAAVAALRDQLDTFWQRALAGYTDIVIDGAEQTMEESS